MAELRSKLDNHHEHIWQCECSDIHYVTLAWDDKDPTWRYLSLVDGWQGRTFRERVKGASKLLRGRYHVGAEILLDEATVAEVLKVLRKHADG